MLFEMCILMRVFVVLVKKLLRNMTDYYGDVLRMNPPNLPSDELPNLSSIAKEKSSPDIVKFLRLVLALAVKSNKKEDYVQTIYTLSPEAQKALMYLLQQVYSSIYHTNVGGIGSFTRIFSRERTPQVRLNSGYSNRSEDEQIRFEQEIAEISAERDAVEKARLMLLDEHETLKAEAVYTITYSSNC